MSNTGFKKFRAGLYHASNILLRSTKYRAQKRLSSNTLKKNELKVYISLMINKSRVINWHVLHIAKTQFTYTIWFMISEKSITMCTFIPTERVSQPGIKKMFTRIFNSFSPETTFMWTTGFYRYEHLYTYRRQGLLSIFEKKLCSCFGQLLHVH